MCDIWPVVGVIKMMNTTCGTWPYLPSWTFVSNSSFNGVSCAKTLIFLWWPLYAFCSFSGLTFVLRYVSSRYTNVVFRLSLYLLGLKLSLYLVHILYFVVSWLLIRLHQSKQAHSTTCQDLLNCKHTIPTICPCCNLQNRNPMIQRLNISIFHKSGWNVNIITSGLNVKIIHKWLEMLKMSTLYPNGQKVRNINIIHKWLKV